MNTAKFFRVAAMSLALAVPVAMASAAHAQDQYQRYDYARDSWPHIQAAENQPNRSAQAKGPSAIASDASQAILSTSADPGPYNPEAILTQEGANAQ
ncbi:MAG TPA: hypothetical protein VN832_12290 [Stellaceae bacterium]|nr:hypothetical protein [Stellaceae bacterium]